MYIITHAKTQVSKDGEKIEVELEVAKMSNLVANTLDDDVEEDDDDDDDNDDTGNDDIFIPKVETAILKKTIEFCKHYKHNEEMTAIQTPLQSSKIEDVVQEWYADFCKTEDETVLFQLVSAANFMDIEPLLDLSCFAVATKLKGKSETEIRRIFNMSENRSAAENHEIQVENEWTNKP